MYVVHGMFISFYWFCWKYQYNKYMFNVIDNLNFYFCEWLCRYGPQCTALPGAYNADETALGRMCVYTPSASQSPSRLAATWLKIITFLLWLYRFKLGPTFHVAYMVSYLLNAIRYFLVQIYIILDKTSGGSHHE